MTFIVASGNGPTDEQFASLNAQVDVLTKAVSKERLASKVEKAVEQALRPIAAEIALMEKQLGVRDGMLINRKPANDDWSDYDLNAPMDEKP